MQVKDEKYHNDPEDNYKQELKKVIEILDRPKDKRKGKELDILLEFFLRFKSIRDLVTKNGNEFLINLLKVIEYKNLEIGTVIIKPGTINILI